MSVERSQSRGREPFVSAHFSMASAPTDELTEDTQTSVGRGGAGNIIRSDSVSRDRVADERGRELSPSHPDRVTGLVLLILSPPGLTLGVC